MNNKKNDTLYGIYYMLNEENINKINQNTEELSQDRERTKNQWIEDTKETTIVSLETMIPVSKRLPSFNIVGFTCLTLLLLAEILMGVFVFIE